MDRTPYAPNLSVGDIQLRFIPLLTVEKKAKINPPNLRIELWGRPPGLRPTSTSAWWESVPLRNSGTWRSRADVDVCPTRVAGLLEPGAQQVRHVCRRRYFQHIETSRLAAGDPGGGVFHHQGTAHPQQLRRLQIRRWSWLIHMIRSAITRPFGLRA